MPQRRPRSQIPGLNAVVDRGCGPRRPKRRGPL